MFGHNRIPLFCCDFPRHNATVCTGNDLVLMHTQPAEFSCGCVEEFLSTAFQCFTVFYGRLLFGERSVVITSIQGRMHFDIVGHTPCGKLVAVCTVYCYSSPFTKLWNKVNSLQCYLYLRLHSHLSTNKSRKMLDKFQKLKSYQSQNCLHHSRNRTCHIRNMAHIRSGMLASQPK